MEPHPKISVLVSARKNSKYLAKFLFGYFANSAHPEDMEILVCMNLNDTWNAELVTYFETSPLKVKFFYEDLQLGRAGLHEYLNIIAQQATGDWLIYFCEDHFINARANDIHALTWDEYFLARIHSLQLDPTGVYCIVPKFDNAGAMNHMISRGYYNALGGYVGYHGWIDSYLNDVNKSAFGDYSDRVIRMDNETFHDFTHDQPNPMDDAHMQSVIGEAAAQIPKHGSEEYRALVADGARKIKQSIRG